MWRRVLFWLSVIFIIITAFAIYIFITWEKPPVTEIAEARFSLTAADKENKSPSAMIIYKEAEKYYDSAMFNWQIENEKFFFNRDFKQVREFANLANQMALNSINKAKEETQGIKEVLTAKKDNLLNNIKFYNSVFRKVPLNENQNRNWTKGTMLLQEGIFAYEKEDFQTALQKFESSEILLNRIIQYSTDFLRGYFESYPDWKELADNSVSKSRKEKSYSIVIDKYARKCLLFYQGALNKEFDIELGSNWMGDKNLQGDKTTPEGSYKIVRKKKDGETRFYKALLLNYPNEADKKRFKKNKQKGQIDENATIGNLIEIHGNGGKGTDWTDGCIALEDKNMDKLFSACNVGTEVIIVGSLLSFDKVLNKTK